MMRRLFPASIILLLCIIFQSTLGANNGISADISETANYWLQEGKDYAMKNLNEKALNAFNKAITLEPRNSKAYLYRANLYDNMGNTNNALADYAMAIKLDARNDIIYFERALLYAKQGNHSDALKDFNQAIALRGAEWGYNYNRGLAYANIGQLDNALEDFNKSIELNHKFYMSYFSRGQILSKLGQTDAAIVDYDRAIRLKSDFASAYCNRGKSYIKIGYDKVAKKDTEKGAWLYNDKGIQYAEKGDINAAEKMFQSAIECDEAGYNGYYNMGCIAALKKNTAQACTYLDKAVEKGFTDWAAMKDDASLNNIRDARCYKKILEGKQ